MSTTPPTDKQRPQGPWLHRLLIAVFSLLFGILILWLLGFLVEDIQTAEGPKFEDFEKSFIEQSLVDQEKQQSDQLAGLSRDITNKQERLQIIRESSTNLERTMNQLVELQKLTVQKSVAITEAEQANLSASLKDFLANQKQYEQHHAELSQLTEQKRSLEAQHLTTTASIASQRETASKKFESVIEKHRLKLAFWQLAILIPILVIAALLLAKFRSSIYRPLFLAFAAAALYRVVTVVHEYFPSRYVKYVFIAAAILVVARLLIYLIRVVAYPKAQWLIRQYREAYERFLCPVCEYPIRTGPRKFLFWTRRTVNRVLPAQEKSEDTPYACPACGTSLFEECTACHSIRHSLLPHCHHCNATKPLPDFTSTHHTTTDSATPSVR